MELLYNNNKYNIIGNKLYEDEESLSSNLNIENSSLMAELKKQEDEHWVNFKKSPIYKALEKINGNDDHQKKENDNDTTNNVGALDNDVINQIKQVIDTGQQLEKNIEQFKNIDDLQKAIQKQNDAATNSDAINNSIKYDDNLQPLSENLQDLIDKLKNDKGLNDILDQLKTQSPEYFKTSTSDLDSKPVNDIVIVDNMYITQDKRDPRFDTYENDPIYKKSIRIAQADGSITDEYTDAVIELAKVHSDIMNTYTNQPLEGWNKIQIKRFEELLTAFKEKEQILDDVLKTYKWNDPKNEETFAEEIYDDLIFNDYEVYIRLYERHLHYEEYRANRQQLIEKLGKIVGYPRLPHSKNVEAVFNYIVRKADSLPLYEYNTSDYAESTKDMHFVLKKKIYEHESEYMEDLTNFSGSSQYGYNKDDFRIIVEYYIFCRRKIFDIFNMLVSMNKYNGYEKYKSFFPAFYTGKINKNQLEKLYYSLDSTIGQRDDYHNIMDQKIFNQNGLFESSWWDEDVKWYKEHQADRFTKDKITKINMIPTDVNNCKIKSNGKSVYSDAKFYTGDIIEICPCRTVGKESLYSRDMRDITFEVIPHEKWVIPFGYCQYYDKANYKNEPNCAYEWNPKNNTMVIRALNNIDKNQKLILQLVKYDNNR